MSQGQRLHRITQVLAICLLIQVALTFPLWLGARTYPFLPFLDFLSPVSWCSSYAAGLAVLGLVSLLLWSHQWSFLAFLIGIFFAVLLDLSKGQVWLYFQSLLLLVLAFKNGPSKKWVMPGLQLVFPFIYFWAAIHKINGYYFEETFPWLMETFDLLEVFKASTVLIVLSIAVELGIALGLWWERSRKAAVILGITFHLVILLFLGPFGQNWNQVVWPWNLSMMVLLYLLYWGKSQDISLSKLVATLPKSKINAFAFLLLGIMPAFQAVDLWPTNFSFNMYAGNNSEGILFSPQSTVNTFSKATNQQIHCISNAKSPETCYLIIDDWAFTALKAAPFSQKHQLKQVAKKYCSCLDNLENAGLQILEVAWWKKEKPLLEFSCKELLSQ